MKILKRILRAAVIILLAVVLAAGGIRAYVCVKTAGLILSDEELSAYTAGETEKPDLIVLGAGVYKDGSLSPILQNRLDRTLELWNTGNYAGILVSGDHRAGEYDEVDHMAAYLEEAGVPEEALLLDYNGYSTYESIYRAGYYFGITSAVIVTQRYHLYRALYIGESCGMKVRGAEAEDHGDFPGRLKRTLREAVATVKDLYNCMTGAQADLSAPE